jgi:phosphoglycerate dehydrogenase-like enzyme
VCNTVGGAGGQAAPAELALGLLLATARAIPAGDASMRAGRFQSGVPVGISLSGKTIGIIGLGRLGSQMTRYCLALNMTVLAWSENLTAEEAKNDKSPFPNTETTPSTRFHAEQADSGAFRVSLSRECNTAERVRES